MKLEYFSQLLDKAGIATHKLQRESHEFVKLFEYWTQKSYESRRIALSMLDELDTEIDRQWEYYQDLNKRIESTTSHIVDSESVMAIYKASEKTLGVNFYQSLSKKSEERGSSRSWESGNVNYKCGIIAKS